MMMRRIWRVRMMKMSHITVAKTMMMKKKQQQLLVKIEELDVKMTK